MFVILITKQSIKDSVYLSHSICVCPILSWGNIVISSLHFSPAQLPTKGRILWNLFVSHEILVEILVVAAVEDVEISFHFIFLALSRPLKAKHMPHSDYFHISFRSRIKLFLSHNFESERMSTKQRSLPGDMQMDDWINEYRSCW